MDTGDRLRRAREDQRAHVQQLEDAAACRDRCLDGAHAAAAVMKKAADAIRGDAALIDRLLDRMAEERRG